MIERARRGPSAGVAALAAASVALFLISRGKWSDAIIDSGSEWIYPDSIARGGLLYRDVVYWFGPFTPYFHAGFFRLLGSSFQTLVVSGVVGSLGALAALFLALRRVTGKREAALWTALAVPALVFMPNSGGSILGMGYRSWHPAAFALAAVGVASRPSSLRRPLATPVAAGALCALAALCRTEWGLVAAAAVLASYAKRDGIRRPFLRDALAAGSAFVVLTAGVLAGFAWAAGRKAVLADGHLLLTRVPEETRTFLIRFSGILEWRRGMLELLYSAGTWIGAVLLLYVVAIGRTDPARVRRKLPWLAATVLLLLSGAALGGAGGAVLFSAAPLVCALAIAVGLSGSSGSSGSLVGFGLAGLLFFHRRPFHIVDGAYVAPPLLFAFVCAAALVQWLLDREADFSTRERFRSLATAGVLLLIALAFAGRAAQYRSDERVPIPGTEGMLSARPDLVSRLTALARLVRRESAPGEGLVVFPEGAVVNYLSGRPNALRHKLYIPGYLTEENEGEVLAELGRSPPGVIVVLDRPTSEYGRAVFGADYGKRIRRWIDEHYDVLTRSSSDPTSRRLQAWAVVAVRKGRR